jgi:hypothetical protein
MLVKSPLRCSLGASSSSTVSKPARTRSALELRRSLHVGSDGLLMTSFEALWPAPSHHLGVDVLVETVRCTTHPEGAERSLTAPVLPSPGSAIRG